MIIDGTHAVSDQVLDVDYCIVGSGSGGAYAASLLSAKGFRVAVVEEGPYRKTEDFKEMREDIAYPELYQELASRKTRDHGIGILQGRNVGGGTTVNWTTCFRTPEKTLEHWRANYGLSFDLSHHFSSAEKDFSISKWDIPPNLNNEIIALGAHKLGWSFDHIKRNVKGCYNLGYCGVGCPTGAKQSQLVTSIPNVLKNNGILATRYRVQEVKHHLGVVSRIVALNMPGIGNTPGTNKLTIHAKHFIIAAGAIGTPALLLRSRIHDPSGMLGKRTFLHPTVISGAIFEQEIDAFQGAPQSIYSDHFLWDDYGFKIEVPPVHPLLLASTLMQRGSKHRELMLKLKNLQVCIALQRDGFAADSHGGQVELRGDGSPALDYVWNENMGAGFKRALLAMGELQFAAGAKEVLPIHLEGECCRSFSELKRLVSSIKMERLKLKVVSAHVMGGACFGHDEKQSVCDQNGRLWAYKNLAVMDGSLFPTSIAANPMLSILGHVRRIYS